MTQFMHLTTVSYKDKFWWWFGARQLVTAIVVVYIIFAAIEGTHVKAYWSSSVQ